MRDNLYNLVYIAFTKIQTQLLDSICKAKTASNFDWTINKGNLSEKVSSLQRQTGGKKNY